MTANLNKAIFFDQNINEENTLQKYFMLLIATGVLVLGLLPQTILTTGLLICSTVIYRHYRVL